MKYFPFSIDISWATDIVKPKASDTLYHTATILMKIINSWLIF